MNKGQEAAIRRVDTEISSAWLMTSNLQDQMSRQRLPVEIQDQLAKIEKAIAATYEELLGIWPELIA